MRNEFARLIHDRMKVDSRIFLLYGDIGNKLFDPIKNDFPKRVLNAGVAEANMVTVAAGLAHGGLLPICYTINSFLYLKALEQIKLDLAYPSRQVILVGTGGGLSYGELGTSHHSLEDYSVLSSIPNISIYSPGDFFELAMSLDLAANDSKPSYLRIGKKGEKNIAATDQERHNLNNTFYRYFGAGNSDLAVVSIGIIGSSVKEALIKLENNSNVDGYSVYKLSAWHDEEMIKCFGKYKSLLIIEEHYSIGGLSSLFKNLFFDNNVQGTNIYSQNISHEFITSQGNQVDIREKYNLNVKQILNRIQSILEV